MAKLIPTSGPVREVAPGTGPTFELIELQQIVGGYIEALRLGALWLFLNEDGKRLNLPLNERATALMRGRIADDDWIVGDVILCSPTEAGEEAGDDAV